MWWSDRHDGVGVARMIAVLALTGSLAGCFQPLYGDRGPDGNPSLRDALSSVDIQQIAAPKATDEERLAVEIRNALIFDFTGGSTAPAPSHRLKIAIASTRTSVIVDINTSRPDVENYGINASLHADRGRERKGRGDRPDFRARVGRYARTAAAIRACARSARCRKPRRKGDCGKHPLAACFLFCRRDLIAQLGDNVVIALGRLPHRSQKPAAAG